MKPENCESIKENLGSTQSSGYNSNTSDEGLQIMSPKNTSRLSMWSKINYIGMECDNTDILI